MVPETPEPRTDGTSHLGETLGYAAPRRPVRNRVLTVMVMIAASGVLLVWAGAFVRVGVAEWRAMRERLTGERITELQADRTTEPTTSAAAEAVGAATTPTDAPQSGR